MVHVDKSQACTCEHTCEWLYCVKGYSFTVSPLITEMIKLQCSVQPSPSIGALLSGSRGELSVTLQILLTNGVISLGLMVTYHHHRA